MRRHLAKLVASGLVARRDSPNGKRYARRFAGEKIAYGFDLSPLLHRYDDICDRAETARAAQEEHRRQRETVSLMRRDLASLADYGAELRPDLSIWDQFADMARLTARALRRKLPLIELTAMAAKLKDALEQLRNILDPQESVEQPTVQTPKMSTIQPQNEQHHQNSKKDSYESEEPTVEENYASENTPVNKEEQNLPNIPLSLVLEACSEIQTYSQTKIRHWHEFVQLGDHMHRMMGIPHHVWDLAKRVMGPEQAASVLASILERFTEIQNHGGYLRALCNKTERGEFSCGPMIMALLRKTG
jgi:replication initiation protein RepC